MAKISEYVRELANVWPRGLTICMCVAIPGPILAVMIAVPTGLVLGIFASPLLLARSLLHWDGAGELWWQFVEYGTAIVVVPCVVGVFAKVYEDAVSPRSR